ncbi:PREDICTED: natterin-3-like [Rhagoletis zephyria]|uniref:natterin-3-like n=1 Tax=Rhagoletis zephyria TaxID=28612 RepID=UPI000811992C|nr:PREDICTED: natterin-3-like [Rhagoletis zephyria]
MAEWRHASYGFVPDDAVAGGHDVNGETIYVGRCHMDGDLVPGKIVPSHGVVYVPISGEEKNSSTYEYLVRPNYGSLEWVPSADGVIPSGAVNGGHTSSQEPLFIGRAYYEGSWVIGKVHQTHRVLYVPFAGRESALSDYEVLVIRY